MRRIVAAVDGSDHAMRAAEFAGELSKAFDVPVDILNVVSDSAVVTNGGLHEYSRIEKVTITQRDLLQSAGVEVVAQAAALIRDHGGKLGRSDVLVGSPAHQIAHYAERSNADCIVMGRRGLGDIKGLLMGSVSHRVGQLSGATLVTTE